MNACCCRPPLSKTLVTRLRTFVPSPWERMRLSQARLHPQPKCFETSRLLDPGSLAHLQDVESTLSSVSRIAE